MVRRQDHDMQSQKDSHTDEVCVHGQKAIRDVCMEQ